MIKVKCDCWLCGHEWIEEKENTRAFDAVCPKCGDDFIIVPDGDVIV